MKDVMAAHRAAGPEDSSSFSIAGNKAPLKYVRMFIDIFTSIEECFDH